MNYAIHTSAKEAGCVPQKHFKPKKFWCPSLSRLRDKKRMWWTIWVQCGRPRSGTIYDCWKGSKKIFRKTCRHNMNNILNSQVDKMNHFFSERRTSCFWNVLRTRKRSRNNSNLVSKDFVNYFESVMNDDSEMTKSQTEIIDDVREHCQLLENSYTHVSVPTESKKQVCASYRWSYN